VRTALAEAAERRRRRNSLAEEVRRISQDPADQAELAEVQALMDEIRVPW
jgi:hypothetical protein